MKPLIRNNWKAILAITLAHALLLFFAAYAMNTDTLNRDTDHLLNRAQSVQTALLSTQAIPAPETDTAKILSADTSNAAISAIKSGASYGRTLSGHKMSLTLPLVTNGKTTGYLQVTDTRTSAAFAVNVVTLLTLIFWIFSLTGLIRRARRNTTYTSNTVAKIKNIERSPLTQSYLINKNDDAITTAINHLGETIQARIDSGSERKENLYEFIAFFQFPIFVYDGKGAIRQANHAFINEFSEQPSIDIFSPYPDFLNFLVTKMVRPDIQEATFYFEDINSYYQVHFNPLVDIENRFLVSMHDVSQFQNIVQAHNDFIANVSHEFKTPLTSIRGFADILEQGRASEQESLRFARLIRKETERLMALVSDTLFLTKQTAKIHKKSTDLSHLIQGILDNLSPQILEKNLQIETLIENINFRTDPALAHGIFKNLIENAIFYTPEHGMITVSLQSEKRRPVFSVADTGIGLTELQKSRIFERFYRTDEGKSNASGTGLGLAIVQKNIQDLGGQISLDSSPGVGTRFTVHL